MTRNKQEETLVDDIIEKVQHLKRESPDKWKRSLTEYLATLPKIDMLKLKEIVYGYFRLLQ